MTLALYPVHQRVFQSTFKVPILYLFPLELLKMRRYCFQKSFSYQKVVRTAENEESSFFLRYTLLCHLSCLFHLIFCNVQHPAKQNFEEYLKMCDSIKSRGPTGRYLKADRKTKKTDHPQPEREHPAIEVSPQSPCGAIPIGRRPS